MATDNEAKIAWLNFLKSFTRALVQINLYKPDHPQVKQVLEEGTNLLAEIIKTCPHCEFSLTLDHDKLIVNETPFLTADKLPNSLRNLFVKFQIQTISFLDGITQEELRALCQIQTFKGEVQDYLKTNNIEHIKLTKALYAKIDKNAPGSSETPQPPLTGDKPQNPSQATAATTEQSKASADIHARIQNQNLESALDTIVSQITPDREEQRKIIEMVMSKIKAEMEAEINRALKEIRNEKQKVDHDIARTEAVFSNMAEGVVVVNKEGKIIMMNPQAEAISGADLTDLSGQSIFDVAKLENQVVSLANELKPGETGRTPSVEQKGESSVTQAIKKSTAIIQNEDGKIVGSLSIPTDKAKLAETEQLQRDFVANMTHELRSPLTSIKAALEILSKETKTDDSGKMMLNAAIRNSERLNAIITDILDFSKLQSGKLIFHQSDESPEEIANEAAEAMKAWTNSKGVTMTVKAASGTKHIYADKRRTVQLLINLISNAIKFTPQSGTIELSVDNGRDTMSGFVFFSVKDSGIGIKKEDQTKIFSKFIQVAAGEKVGGTGLGLAITKAMAVMQGGSISVESDPGRGATFRVAMPAYKGQLEAPVFEQLPEVKKDLPWWKKLFGA